MTAPIIAASTGLIPSSAASALLVGEDWTAQLGLLARAGYTAIDLSDLWVSLGELDDAGVERLRDAIAGAGLAVVGASVIGVEVHLADRADAGRRWAEASIDVAGKLGLDHVSIGLHPRPPRNRIPGARPAWIDAAPPVDEPQEQYDLAAGHLRDLAQRASDLGMTTSLEMHERTLVRTGRTSLRLLETIGRDDVGMNPDLGNLIRVPWQLEETWYETLEAIAPLVRYWHIKNSQRVELPGGAAVGVATTLLDGQIDYRAGLALLHRVGYTGPLVVEHYGGDSLGIAADSRRYLAGLVDEVGMA